MANDQLIQPSEAALIQIAFPSEPEWESLSDGTLIELVLEFGMEPSCAEFALGELVGRRHPLAEELCNYHTHAEYADKWLRAGALDKLLLLNPLEGLSKAMAFIEDDSSGVLEGVMAVLDYEHQGPLTEAIHRHPIVPMVKRKIAHRGADAVDFSDIFASTSERSNTTGDRRICVLGTSMRLHRLARTGIREF